MRYLVWCSEILERWQGSLIDASGPGMAAHRYCMERYYRDSCPNGYDVLVEDEDGKQERFGVLVELEPHFIAYPLGVV